MSKNACYTFIYAKHVGVFSGAVPNSKGLLGYCKCPRGFEKLCRAQMGQQLKDERIVFN